MKKCYYVYEMLWIGDLIKTIELDTLESYDEAVQLAELAQLDINNYNHEYNFDDVAVYIDEMDIDEITIDELADFDVDSYNYKYSFNDVVDEIEL